MKAEAAMAAAQLLRQQRIAALGTLHDGAPSVTLVPFVLAGDDPLTLIVLVSALASHTRDMRADSRVAMLIAEPEPPDAPVHALARVALQAMASAVERDDPRYGSLRAAYIARFPEREDLFALGDFALFEIEPTTVRVVSGFAQAASITPGALAAAVAQSRAARR